MSRVAGEPAAAALGDRLAASCAHRELARSLGLDASGADAVLWLARLGELTLRSLGQRVGLSSGGRTYLLRRLEAAQLVVRRSHPRDARIVLVRLCPEAQERVMALVAEATDDQRVEQAGSQTPHRARTGNDDAVAQAALTPMGQFALDALSLADWEVIRDLDRAALDPFGQRWPRGTTSLQRLVAWASWGFVQQAYASSDP